MDYLSNEVLVDSYKEALKLELSKDFISLFEMELVKRNLLLDVKNN